MKYLLSLLIIPTIAFAQSIEEFSTEYPGYDHLDISFERAENVRSYAGIPVLGYYLIKEDRIVISKSNRRWIRTLLHEIGHHVYFKRMTAEQRRHYSALYYEERVVTTNYSKTRIEENFAEMFVVAVGNDWEGIRYDKQEKIKNSKQYKFIKSL